MNYFIVRTTTQIQTHLFTRFNCFFSTQLLHVSIQDFDSLYRSSRTLMLSLYAHNNEEQTHRSKSQTLGPILHRCIGSNRHETV